MDAANGLEPECKVLRVQAKREELVERMMRAVERLD
jgi:hypothetical protein